MTEQEIDKAFVQWSASVPGTTEIPRLPAECAKESCYSHARGWAYFGWVAAFEWMKNHDKS